MLDRADILFAGKDDYRIIVEGMPYAGFECLHDSMTVRVT